MPAFAICDDNEKFGNYLKTLLLHKLPAADVSVYSSVSGMTAELIKSSASIDVFFLDIVFENEDANGIETAKMLHSLYPCSEIVFISESASFISDVYSAPHCFFIKKSDIESYLTTAVEKALKTAQTKRLVIKEGGGQHTVEVRRILYIERVVRTSVIHFADDELRTKTSLEELLQLLPLGEFVRCHCSFLVAIPHISSYTRTSCVLDNGVVVPVSRNYSEEFKSKILSYWGNVL